MNFPGSSRKMNIYFRRQHIMSVPNGSEIELTRTSPFPFFPSFPFLMFLLNPLFSLSEHKHEGGGGGD